MFNARKDLILINCFLVVASYVIPCNLVCVFQALYTILKGLNKIIKLFSYLLCNNHLRKF